jgi:predicted KAP-like P-loop ATPase
MRKNRKSAGPDLVQACQRLAETAETFVNRAPRQKRLEAERSALFDALSHAQLVLSVTRLPQASEKDASTRQKPERETRGLEEQLKQSQAELVKSQQALAQLDWLIAPVATTLFDLQDKANRAQTVVKTALTSPAPVIPFRKSR